MIRIEANTLYTRGDLAEMLGAAGVDVDTFIARLKPRKVFKMVWLGEDILTALRVAPALPEREERAGGEPANAAPIPPARVRAARVRAARCGTVAVVGRPGAKIDAYLNELRGGKG